MTEKGKSVDNNPQTSADQDAKMAVLPVISELIDKGTRAFALEQWEDAINYFGEMSQTTQVSEQAFGSQSPRYADALVMYGRALLQNAIHQTTLLAKKTLAEAAAKSQQVEENGTPAKKGHIQFEGEPDFRAFDEDGADEKEGEKNCDEPEKVAGTSKEQSNGKEAETSNGGDEGGNDNEDEDDTGDDFSAAWEVLDVARVIQEQQPGKDAQLKLSETLMLLGDVSMESESFEQATKDFEHALLVKKQHLADDDRELAEAYYKLALAYEYNKETGKAIESLESVKQVLDKHKNRLMEEQKNASEDKTKSITEEIKDIDELLNDVSLKCEEWKAPKPATSIGLGTDSPIPISEEAKAILEQALKAGTVNDLTSLARSKKAKAKENPASENGNDPSVDSSAQSAGKRKVDNEPENEESKKAKV
ncbi:hypothetical protein H4219_001152 [Mycoemilia scoparia]|uniref:Tetratricopeptide SHNi-TPR domain-containing protein n=1 Tax=Mycoemilia scoparia TaxID=417184 RepID=A0A9W8DWH5_9FUNG|nr:hypothetical protein H4219_001152 [Mycoemilia scoparia]